MGQQIVKQTKIDGEPFLIDGEECEEGKYAIFSTVVDAFIAFNLTADEVIEFFVSQAVEQTKRETQDRLKRTDIRGGSGFPPFLVTFARAVETAIRVHGDSIDETHGPGENPGDGHR